MLIYLSDTHGQVSFFFLIRSYVILFFQFDLYNVIRIESASNKQKKHQIIIYPSKRPSKPASKQINIWGSEFPLKHNDHQTSVFVEILLVLV
jgi:hypothetical protein